MLRRLLAAALTVVLLLGACIVPVRAEPLLLRSLPAPRLPESARGFRVWTLAGEWRSQVRVPGWEHLPPELVGEGRFVIAAFMGERPTGGHAIEVVKVQRSYGAIRVTVKETYPPPGALLPPSLTYPVHLVQVEGTVEPGTLIRFHAAGGERLAQVRAR